MRSIYFLACINAALDCASKATGTDKLTFIQPEFLWVYWFLAVMWIAIGIAAFFWRPE